MAEMAQLVSAIDGGMPVPPPNPGQQQKPKGKISMPAALGGGSMGLDLSRVVGHEHRATADFQDEFMANINEFSESWRKMIEK